MRPWRAAWKFPGRFTSARDAFIERQGGGTGYDVATLRREEDHDPVASNHDGVLLVATVLLGFFTVAAFRRSFFTRVGTDPHCRQCNYNVRHLPGTTCPECGTTLTPKTIRRGRRQRRPILALAGVFTLLLAALPLAFLTSSRLRAIDWHRHYPTSILLRGVRDADVNAYRELLRRDTAGVLSQAERAALADHAFELAVSPVRTTAWIGAHELRRQADNGDLDGPRIIRLLDFALERARRNDDDDGWPGELLKPVGRLIREDRIPRAARDRLFEACLEPTLVVRPVVIGDNAVPYHVRVDAIGPDGFKVLTSISGVTVDGEPTQFPGFTTTTRAFGGTLQGRAEPCGVGEHTLQLDLRQEVHLDDAPPDSPPLFGRTTQLRAAFRTAADDPGNPPDLTTDARLGQRIRAAVRARRAGGFVHLTLEEQPLPVDVAFDVLLRVDTRVQKIGEWDRPRDRRQVMLAATKAPPRHARVDMILRSNLERARENPDLAKIWHGEILIPDADITD